MDIGLTREKKVDQSKLYKSIRLENISMDSGGNSEYLQGLRRIS